MTGRQLPSLGKDDIARVRAQLYRSVGDLERWPKALAEVAKALGATGFVSGIPSLDPSLGYVFDHISVNVDLELSRKHTEETGTLDPWRTARWRKGYTKPGFILRGGDVCDPWEIERSSWKSQVLDPGGIRDVVVMSFEAPPDSGSDVSIAVFHRHRPHEAFEPEVVERLRLFSDHLALTSKVGFSMRAARRRTALLESALDRVTDAIFILDSAQRLQFHNCAGTEFLNGSDMLAVRQGRLVAIQHGDNERLSHAIFEASHFRKGAGVSFVSESGPPLMASVVPFDPDPERVTSDGPCGVMVTVQCPQEMADADSIGATLCLTAAEAKLAQALGTNRSLPQIAAEFGVSIETLRTQLKSIFAKLNVSKQAEVAQLVQRIPRSC